MKVTKVESITLPGTRSPNKDSKRSRCFTCLENILKPLLISMKIVGMYSDPPTVRMKPEDSESDCSVKASSWVLSWLTNRVYCIVVMLLLWFNCIRGFVGIFPSDENLFFRIIGTTWCLQCAVGSTFMVANCQRLQHLRSFYKHMDSLFTDATTQDMGCNFRCPLKYLRVITVVGWILFAMAITAMFFFFNGNLPGSRNIIEAFARPLPIVPGVLVLSAVLQTFATGAWIFPVIFLGVIAQVIRVQFLHFRNCLSKQIDEADGFIPDYLSEFRSRYTQLCQALEIMNGTFKWYLGFSFILQIFLACFISYQIINDQPHVFTIASYVFWLSTCVVCLLVLAISSSGVHDSAHVLLNEIFRLGTKNATAEQLGQLNLFVAKLTGTSIGFTAIDFFVITKEFLLTLAGLFLTYFFLLLQFKMSLP